MSDLIELEFTVRAEADHAFRVWTERCSTWWPRSHSMSGDEDFEVVFEPWTDGRIFEIGRDGAQFDWGRILAWEPPTRVRYSWHIFLDPELATIVEVIFTPRGDETIVRLRNSGFEVFGDGAADRSSRVGGAWSALTGSFAEAI